MHEHFKAQSPGPAERLLHSHIQGTATNIAQAAMSHQQSPSFPFFSSFIIENTFFSFFLRLQNGGSARSLSLSLLLAERKVTVKYGCHFPVNAEGAYIWVKAQPINLPLQR